jgi:hypothetical protein
MSREKKKRFFRPLRFYALFYFLYSHEVNNPKIRIPDAEASKEKI